MKLREIKGHVQPIKILLNSLKTGSLAGSYLFTGPEGIGKSLVAKYLAQVLNCQEDNFEACGVCSSCQKIEKEIHPDVNWVLAEESGVIKIEQIRKLSQEINLRPYEGRFKVFIIVDAQNLNEEAASCLLKTLEEPAAHSLIILITSQIKKLMPTIISRCQKINFSALSPASLEEILIKEHNLPKEESRYLSYCCEGRLGASLRLTSANILREKNQLIADFLNLSGRSFFSEQSLAEKERLRELLVMLMYWFRDIMLLKSGADAASLVNVDQKSTLSSLKDRYSFPEIILALRDIINTNLLLEQNLNVKITLSLLREKLCKG